MRAVGVVVALPVFDFFPSMAQGSEPVQVQALIPELAVEALDEGILHRFAWFDEAPPHTSFLRPFEHRLAGAFWPVIEELCDPGS